MPNFNSIGSGVSEPQVAENRHLPLTGGISLTTVYALTCYTVIKGKSLIEKLEQELRLYSLVNRIQKCVENGLDTSCVCLITEPRSKYSAGNQLSGVDHEERPENTGWVVLRKICLEQRSQDNSMTTDRRRISLQDIA